jgi:hypothetical protein
MRTRRVGAAILAAVVACCAIASAQEAASKHFLWKVTSPSGGEAYLLGSVHVLTKSYYPLSPTIDQAFAWSRTLVEEVDLDEMNNPATMIGLVGKATLPQGQTLDQLVSAETFAAVSKRAEANGIPLMLLQRMKPWMAAVIASIVAAFLYVRVIKVMYFDEPVGDGPSVAYPSVLTATTIAVGAAVTLVLGILPGPVLDLAAVAGEFIR